jgi:hypothetical protein
MRPSRRRLLRSSAGLLALPALSGLARSAPVGALPKRLLILHTPQGTVLSQHVPVGTESSFALPFILEPLAAFQDRMVLVTGLDNRVPNYNSVGNAHQNANFTLYTGQPFATQDSSNIAAGGPSIEQLIAERLSSDTPFPRIDLAVGGASSNGVYQPSEGSYFWYGANDPVSFYNDPLVALIRIFGDQTMSPADAWALRARRAAVLGAVMEGFAPLRGRVGAEDQQRLDAHLEKIESLEARIASGTGECNAPELSTTSGYDYELDDDITAPLMNEIAATALSCDLTRVMTLHFANSQDHAFPWLWAANGGPIVDTRSWDNWHAMVHADHQPGMELVYQWYMTMLADLLEGLASRTDADGDNLLDTTLVLCMSEYSSGRHWNNALPALLFGHLGGGSLGRWVNHMSGSVEDYEARSGYLDSNATVNQLMVSLLHAFGFDDESFGLVAEDLPGGPLDGLA